MKANEPDNQLIWETLKEAGDWPKMGPRDAGDDHEPEMDSAEDYQQYLQGKEEAGRGPDGVEIQKGSVWDSQGKALKVGDMVKHEREDAEFIVLHVGENDVQLAELGEGIMAQGKELTIMDQDSMGY